jgi:fatty acid desaturase
MVNYLQHHSEDGVLYTDDTWNFERGAFQTVDCDYGTWVNRWSHYMMDGHLVHHLFFTRVPQYRLEQATAALHKGMDNRGHHHLIKTIDTPDFCQENCKAI